MNWVSQSSTINNYLEYVKSISPNLCYISGGNIDENNLLRGIFLKTTNGGATWSTHYIRDSVYLYGGDFINENTGWLVGSKGSIYKTVNGGLNWQNFSLDNKGKFYSADFVNENIGYIVGDSGIVIKTTNGGLNWIEQNPGVSMSLFCVQFKDQNKGWIVGDGGIILNTTNGGIVIGVAENSQTPERYFLYQNYPNPFNPVTVIKYNVPEKSNVFLKVFDILGREVLTLINEVKNPGTYETEFDGTKLASGLYFYRLEAGDYTETKKMVLIK